ncbi:hypothetical protein JCM3774_002024, partial [Rhodotorula dairenensis]
MLTLDTLPLPILLCIIEYFPVGYIAGEGVVVKWRFGPAESCKENARETIALASCNRALRQLLLPVMFTDCHFGEARPVDKYAERLHDLSRRSGTLLACIRNLTVISFTPKGIEAANACIASLVLNRFGVETLAHILPLADQITKIQVSSERKAPAPQSALNLAPVLVGQFRRSHLSWDGRNVATLDEQRDAFFRDLGAVLDP